MADERQVSVAYVGANAQFLRSLAVSAGSPVREAIERSGVLAQFPEIDLDVNKIGVFGRQVKLDRILEEGDRVEIYRPLIADPKVARQRRAEESNAAHQAAKATG